jgi:hypothetical protein
MRCVSGLLPAVLPVSDKHATRSTGSGLGVRTRGSLWTVDQLLSFIGSRSPARPSFSTATGVASSSRIGEKIAGETIRVRP